jgi:formylglycine-generating enzyme required for sulfatase activity
MRRYDPRGPERGETRVSRGGSWRRHVREVPPASRCGRPPHARAADCGFRVVREVP